MKSERVSYLALVMAPVIGALPAMAQTPQQSIAPPVASSGNEAITNGDSASSNADTTPGEIVVTANKREQRVNNVGLSITAVTGAALAERKITSIQDLATIVPGLTFASTTTNTPVLTLRGVGFNESSLAVYPAVSAYVDQAPLPFPVLGSHAAFDLERVEVLKGPQGTLFGQNSTGGAINYIAAKPTDRFEAGAELTYGRFNDILGNGFISGPLTNDLKARVAVTGEGADGWQRSSSRPYDKNGSISYQAIRGILDWDNGGRVRAALSFNAWRDTSEPQATQYIALRGENSYVHPETLAYPFSPLTPRAADWSTGASTPRSNRKFYQPALRVDVDLTDGITLTSLTSYAHYTQTQSTDGDGMSLAQGDLPQDDGHITSFNQEVRLANSSRSRARWVVGGNVERSKTYENQYLDYHDSSQNNPGDGFLQTDGVYNRQNILNYAGFVSGEYDLTPDKLTLKAAGRYTNSRNRGTTCTYDGGDGRTVTLLNAIGAAIGKVPFTPIGLGDCYALNADDVPGFPYKDDFHQHNISWRFGVDYHLNPTMLLYADASRGYKAGSFPVIATILQSSLAPVTQERLTAYEAGAKLGLFDHKLQFNVAGFYYDYKNKQVRGKINDPLFAVIDLLINVPKSRLYGIDSDFTANPLRGLTLSGSFVYLNSRVQRYSGYDAIGEQVDFAGDRLTYTPKFNYLFDAVYHARLANGGGPFIGATVSGHSSQDAVIGGNHITIPTTAISRTAPGIDHPFEMDGYATVDGRLGYEAPGGRWKAYVWGKNIFNKYYTVNVITINDSTSRYAGRPATYGITVGFNFR